MPLTFNDVKSEIASAVNGDFRATVLWTRLHEKGAGYKDAHAYAVRVGELTGKVLKKYQPTDLAEWNLEDLIPGCLGLNHSMVTAACTEAQKNLNRKSRVGIRPQEPDFDGNRAYGLVEAVKERGEIGKLFYDAGLHPKIVRTAEAHCCKWCDDLAGTYDYDEVRDTGNPVWARHDNCRCLIEYVADRRERVNNYRRR